MSNPASGDTSTSTAKVCVESFNAILLAREVQTEAKKAQKIVDKQAAEVKKLSEYVSNTSAIRTFVFDAIAEMSSEDKAMTWKKALIVTLKVVYLRIVPIDYRKDSGLPEARLLKDFTDGFEEFFGLLVDNVSPNDIGRLVKGCNEDDKLLIHYQVFTGGNNNMVHGN